MPYERGIIIFFTFGRNFGENRFYCACGVYKKKGGGFVGGLTISWAKIVFNGRGRVNRDKYMQTGPVPHGSDATRWRPLKCCGRTETPRVKGGVRPTGSSIQEAWKGGQMGRGQINPWFTRRCSPGSNSQTSGQRVIHIG